MKKDRALNPCTRCNGSGTEPDPVVLAYERLVAVIEEAQVTLSLKHHLRAAAAELCDAKTREAGG